MSVDALGEQARRFYEKYGFVALPGYAEGYPLRPCLPIKTVEQALEQPRCKLAGLASADVWTVLHAFQNVEAIRLDEDALIARIRGCPSER